MKSTCAPRTSYGWQANLVWGASPRQTPYTLSRALLRHARSVLVAHSLRSFAPYMESDGCGTDRRLTNDGQSGASRVASGFSRKFSEILLSDCLQLPAAFPEAPPRCNQLIIGFQLAPF